MTTEEPLTFTEEEQFEINVSLCVLHTILKGRLKSITVQDQRGFINYGRQRDKITVDLVESNYTMVNKDKLNALNERNNVSFNLMYLFIFSIWMCNI